MIKTDFSNLACIMIKIKFEKDVFAQASSNHDFMIIDLSIISYLLFFGIYNNLFVTLVYRFDKNMNEMRQLAVAYRPHT